MSANEQKGSYRTGHSMPLAIDTTQNGQQATNYVMKARRKTIETTTASL